MVQACTVIRSQFGARLLLAVLLWPAVWIHAQPALQFAPASLPGMASNVTARLVYRKDEFVTIWKDPTVRAVYLANRITLDPDFWRSRFSDTDGVAHVGPHVAEGGMFTVTSGNVSDEISRPDINFSLMPNAILVDVGGMLLFNNVQLADIAGLSSYQYSPQQPYVNKGAGYALWPSIALGPNSTLAMVNVSVLYQNPNARDTCEQYNSRVVFDLRQALGADTVIRVNATATSILGPVNITVLVLNGSNNATVGHATAMYNNVTFGCLTVPQAASAGLSLEALAAAIVVPVVVVLLSAAGLVAWCIKRRKRRMHATTAAAGTTPFMKDIEVGGIPGGPPPDIQPGRDQGLPDQQVAAGPPGAVNVCSPLRLSAESYLSPACSAQLAVIPSSSQTPRTSSVQRLSTETSATKQLGVQSVGAASSAAGTDSSSLGPIGSGGALVGSGSGGRGSGSTGEAGGSGGRVGSTADRFSSVSAMLKARSDVAVLRDLKIGPLLGRGSYGRVYRGRWKATTVAVKIIEHMAGAPGTASSGGKRISVGRESMLATNVAHPHVVQTYHISTMTVSDRQSLASSWLAESGGLPGGASSSKVQPPAPVDEDETSSNESHSNHSSTEGQRDMLETWMMMEFCEKGNLERAINQGRFIRHADRQPEMVGILKALLDTASGLDYLHSIGVVHGDLKTANVLLKGSTRDARGFMCKITDFGLSRVLDMEATHVSTTTYGTIVYMPKELLLHGRMTQATDIYSFGLMMWELYTSERVFDEGLSVGQMYYMIAYQDWRPEAPPDCPPGYAELMQACWHEDPQQRPTAQQLLRRLQKLYVQAKQQLAASRAAEAAGAAAAATARQLNSQASMPRASYESETSDTYRVLSATAAEAAGCARANEIAAVGTGLSRGCASSGTAPADLADPGGQAAGSGGGGAGSSGGPKPGCTGGSNEAGMFKPYAAAVLQRKHSGSLPQGSAGIYLSPGCHSSSGPRQTLWQQLQQQDARSTLVPVADLLAAKQHSSEIEPYDDVPSESLFVNATDESTLANVTDSGFLLHNTTDDSQAVCGTDVEDGSQEFSGYLTGPEQKQAAVKAYKLAMELAAGPAPTGSGSASAAAAAAGSPADRLQQQVASAGYEPGSAGPVAAQHGFSSSFRDSFRDSFSTCPLPSVLGDSFAGSSTYSLGPTGSSMTTGRFNSMAFSSAGAPAGAATPSSHSSLGGSEDSARVPLAHSAGSMVRVSPSGVFPSPASSTLQTVHEGSGPLDGSGSPTTTAQTGGSSQQPTPTASSPFAALAQRASSLFGALEP